MRTRTVLAYCGAGLTLAIAACVPFYLAGAFTQAVAGAGLHVDTSYTGGSIARTIDRGLYRVVIYRPVRPHAMQRLDPFVQIVLTPADGLEGTVHEVLALDLDGKPDVQIDIHVPANRNTPVSGTVTALNGTFRSFSSSGGRSFDRLIVRAGNEIVVRVPLAGK